MFIEEKERVLTMRFLKMSFIPNGSHLCDVEIKTWLVAGAPWHIRIHCIETSRNIDYAEGGFALGLENHAYKPQKPEVLLNQQDSLVKFPWGVSGIQKIYGNGQAELIYPNANTNLLNSRTVIPTVKGSLKPGIHWLINAVFGEPGSDHVLNHWDKVPEVVLVNDEIIVKQGGEKSFYLKDVFCQKTRKIIRFCYRKQQSLRKEPYSKRYGNILTIHYGY